MSFHIAAARGVGLSARRRSIKLSGLKAGATVEHSEHERVVLRMLTVFPCITRAARYMVDGAKNRPIVIDRR
jgi:hypothetical protein